MSFKLGEKVFAKVSETPPWPGQIWECKENNYVIRFYPDGNKNLVEGKDIFPFLKYFRSIRQPADSEKFHIAVKELVRDMTAPELIELKKIDKEDIFKQFYKRLYFNTDDIAEYNFMDSIRRLKTFNFVLCSTLQERRPSLIEMCFRALEDLKRVEISSDILLAYVEIIQTVMRLRNFEAVIDKSSSKEDVSEINRRSEILRLKAAEVFEYLETICPIWNEGL